MMKQCRKTQGTGRQTPLLNPRKPNRIGTWDNRTMYETGRAIQVIKGMRNSECNAPTNDAEEEKKDDFYLQLQAVLDKRRQKDITVFKGDFNAKVGADRCHGETWTGADGRAILRIVLTQRNDDRRNRLPSKNVFTSKATWRSHRIR
ncbi:hypothetical protein FSP39_007017 [Pinctada imbricata]|uniref:Endonuclease/exonuclease/phosphatase domain-containing protein n=1 Tax=Pinctada imbricata TaxID=66713 RepID=A0AA89CA35_PINIB|nr:hypothetical protein FSP39_007017 [Pinctada imbricata]